MAADYLAPEFTIAKSAKPAPGSSPTADAKASMAEAMANFQSQVNALVQGELVNIQKTLSEMGQAGALAPPFQQ